MMKLYDETNKGYFNASEVIKNAKPFTFIVGGRAIGKTYGVIKWMIQNNKKFIYLRRTQTESDLQSSPLTSSLTKLLDRYANEYEFSKLSKNVGLIEYDNGGVIYTCALSTFATIRGINMDDVEYIVFDEFIKESHVKAIKNEGLALSNLYESINRNRELDDMKPIILICLANSMDIANDVFMEFDLVSKAEYMTTHDIEVYEENNIMLIICQHSPISKAKEKTVLYKDASEEFARMSLKNEFIMNDFTYIKKLSLQGYKIILQVGDLYLYKKKNDIREYYCTFTKSTSKNVYTTSSADLERFRRKEWRYYGRYLDGYIRFDSYKACALFEKYYKG